LSNYVIIIDFFTLVVFMTASHAGI